jgi:putative monooxygenase
VIPNKVALADVLPNRKRGGEIRTLLAPSTVGATSGFLGVAILRPGEFISEHYHPYSEEFLYVVRGQLSLRLDDEPGELGGGESVLIPRFVRHRLENQGGEEVLAVFFLSPLAPRPELGHVDTEDPPGDGAQPTVGPSAPVSTAVSGANPRGAREGHGRE